MEQPSEATTPAEPSPLGPLKAFLILLAFFGAQLATGIFIGVAGGVWFVLLRGHAGSGVIEEAQRAVVMPAALFGLAMGGLVALGLTWRSFPGSGPEGLRSIGWSTVPRRDLLVAGVAGITLAVLYVFVAVYLYPPTPGLVGGLVAQGVSSGGLPRHLWAGLLLAVAPPVEEFVFRGVLFAGFSRSWSVPSAGTVVTLLFLATHLPQVWGYAPAMVSITVVGAAALVARILTHSLAPAVALHVAYNLVLVAAVYAGAA